MDGRLRRLRLTELAMARELRWWLAAVLLACGAVAVAYLPPRGAEQRPGVGDAPIRQTPARLRAQGLAAQWRGAEPGARGPAGWPRLPPRMVRRRAGRGPRPPAP